MIDTHCHIQRDTADPPPPSDADDVLYCPMAVDEADWEALPKLGGVVAYGLGIHPWRAHLAAEGWEGRLEASLRSDSLAIVGECGLDKAARAPETGRTEWAAQQTVFEAQMRLAAALGRPVSVHCVRAHGALYEYLREAEAQGEGAAPPTVALHSYTGSPDLAVSLLKCVPVYIWPGNGTDCGCDLIKLTHGASHHPTTPSQAAPRRGRRLLRLLRRGEPQDARYGQQDAGGGGAHPVRPHPPRVGHGHQGGRARGACGRGRGCCQGLGLSLIHI